VLRVTRILRHPFLKPPFNFLLGDYSFDFGSFNTFSYLLNHIKMILNVFKRAVIWQFLQ